MQSIEKKSIYSQRTKKKSRKRVDKRSILSLLLLFSSLLLYAGILLLGDLSQNIPYYFALLTPLFGIYAFFVIFSIAHPDRIRFPLKYFLWFALLFRICIIPAGPSLSDDIYRYLWDGRVSSVGINPYRYPPEAEELHSLADAEIYPLINYPEIATVYPPVAQILFLTNTFFGNTILSWKILLLISEILLIGVLIKLLDFFHIPRLRLVIFVLNPLLIIETYHSGHLEMFGLLFMMTAVWFFFKDRDGRSLFFISLAVLIKFMPLLVFLPMLIKRFWKKSLILLAILSLSILPFTINGTIPMSGFFSYASRWSFNGGVYHLVTGVLDWFNIKHRIWFIADLNGHLETFYVNPDFYYRLIALAVLITVMADQMRKLYRTRDFRGINYLQAGIIITGTILLITPTLHPWYLIWILPLLVFLPNWSWILFTFLIQAAYMVLIEHQVGGSWKESDLILIIEYLPFYTLLLWEYIDRKNIKGWLTDSSTG